MPVSGMTGAFLRDIPDESVCPWYRYVLRSKLMGLFCRIEKQNFYFYPSPSVMKLFSMSLSKSVLYLECLSCKRLFQEIVNYPFQSLKLSTDSSRLWG